MRSIEEIRLSLNGFCFDSNAERALSELATEMEKHPKSQELIQDVLLLFERYPNEDFGMPGPLAHVIEKHYTRGYEDKLIQSLIRCPTSLTIWLANRIINAADGNRDQFVSLLEETASRSDIAKSIRDEAKYYLSRIQG